MPAIVGRFYIMYGSFNVSIRFAYGFAALLLTMSIRVALCMLVVLVSVITFKILI